MATLKFLGAAQEVTGSCYLMESSAFGKIILDCGMHQGGDDTNHNKDDSFAFNPASIDALILSHAHIDHSGLIPKLVHDGFRGAIYCTEATAELLDIMLHDSVGLYERDLERENLYRARKGKELLKPEYVKADVKKALKLCRTREYEKPVKISADASVTFHDAGHILGSSIVEINFTERSIKKTLVFSGDLGNKDAVLMNDPIFLEKADVVLMEGTYGNRNHRNKEDTIKELRQILDETWQKGGNVMIPAFAVGRTQEIIFYLGQLHHAGELENWKVILDSPMAISVTKVYDRWLHTLDCSGVKKLCSGDKALIENFIPKLHLAITPDESMAINRIKQGAIIIAGSGMCTGGRIRHHFKHRIWNNRNTVIFAGFQARHTLGRKLVDGAKRISMWGEEYAVKARVETLGGFSAHAGQDDLIEWVSHFKNNPRIMLIHGEAESLNALSEKLWKDKAIASDIPHLGQTIAF